MTKAFAWHCGQFPQQEGEIRCPEKSEGDERKGDGKRAEKFEDELKIWVLIKNLSSLRANARHSLGRLVAVLTLSLLLRLSDKTGISLRGAAAFPDEVLSTALNPVCNSVSSICESPA